MHSLKIVSKVKDYEVRFVNSHDHIIEETNKPNTITFIDSNVASLYPELNKEGFVPVFCNEDAKTIEGTHVVLNQLISRKANSKTKLVVIGGGILQDLIGYCASIYCRGIEYILVPTTLLAQADSCIGGKTSINYGSRKNILGTFFPPSKILIDTNFTKTLTRQDYISGLGEVYKFHILQAKMPRFDPNGSVEEMVLDGLRYKADIISRDEFDKGERRFLNFGHTFGHALETISQHEIPHGIAVILGSMIAVTVSKRLGHSVSDYDIIMDRGRELLGLSMIQLKPEWFDYDTLSEIIKSDKKSDGNLTMVLIDETPFLTNIKDKTILTKTLEEIHASI
jgi:3-dehydroquinate synthase